MDPYTITLPPFTAQAPPRQRGPSAPRSAAPSGGSWLGSPNMNNAALGDQIMGGNMFTAAVRSNSSTGPSGPMAAFGPQVASSPFTMVMRPNADPTNSQRRHSSRHCARSQWLSSTPAFRQRRASYNLGYGGGGRGPAACPRSAAAIPRSERHQRLRNQAAAARMAAGLFASCAAAAGSWSTQPLGPPQKAPPISSKVQSARCPTIPVAR